MTVTTSKKKVFSINTALVQGLTETVHAAENYSGSLRVDVIPLQRIETDPENPRDLALNFTDIYNGITPDDPLFVRKNEEKLSLETIAHSIKEQGILNPVIVYKYGEKYRLVAGERRVLASAIAQKEDIQAKVLDRKPAPLQLSLLQWIENMEREDLSLWERLRNLEKIVEEYAVNEQKQPIDITPSQIKQLLGCSLPHAMNYKAVLSSSLRLKDLIKSNQIKNLEKAALIAKAPPDQQEALIKRCLDGAPLKVLKNIPENEEKKASISSRGRPIKRINLGTTQKPEIIKFLVEAVLASPQFRQFEDQFKGINWQNYKIIDQTFKKVVQLLEKQIA